MGHARNALSRDCYTEVNDRITRSLKESVACVYQSSVLLPLLYIREFNKRFTNVDNYPLNYKRKLRNVMRSIEFLSVTVFFLSEQISLMSMQNAYANIHEKCEKMPIARAFACLRMHILRMQMRKENMQMCKYAWKGHREICTNNEQIYK